MKKIAILGGGPAALMLASELDKDKYQVSLVEKNKAIGRKFLVAGDGGLNLTYNSSVINLINEYFPTEFMSPILGQFNNQDLINWFNRNGISTFIGSSNRVFPDLNIKPIQVLNAMIESAKQNDTAFKLNTKWIGWKEDDSLKFEEEMNLEFDIVVFALGGASWKVTGSDGKWGEAFVKRGVKLMPFRSANCAFEVDWHPQFRSMHSGKPLKNIAVTFNNSVSKGELVITNFGLEGNAIYALSREIQDALISDEATVINLDLKPTMSIDQIKSKYKHSQHSKPTDILQSDLNLDRASIALLKQFTDKKTFNDPQRLAETIKSVPITIKSAEALDKAISSLGGISLQEIDENFQLNKLPNTYVIGEMLDWYAPTGGYLLQACFSMGYVLAKHLNKLEY